jgi:peroxiredoxin
MSIKTLNGSSLDTKTLDGKVILILFQPDCDHCQREAKEIKDNMEAFKEYSIYFITADQLPAIEKFAKDHDLLNRSNVSFGMTTVENVLNNFGPIPAPSVYIYGAQQLKHKFNGETSIEKILKVL